ncbi:MAG: ABC transporter ATP-binding protein [Pirellulales bacterium]|nr:ABC transporter ATP-binding protein [Pirellulales bacterium]
MPLLSLTNVSAGYGPIRALAGISLTVEPGEIVTIIGANGAGKSSTLRCISGIIRPTAGTIHFQGQPIHAQPANQIVRLGLCQSPEGRQIFPRLTVRENLEMGAFTRADARNVQADLTKMYQLFPILRERATQLGGTLSGGEQQMLAIARALMGRPQLLLLDEPSLGLAPLIVHKIFEVIRQLNAEGMAILLVEQNARLALRIASRGYVLETGQITLCGPAKELLHDERIREAYLGG